MKKKSKKSTKNVDKSRREAELLAQPSILDLHMNPQQELFVREYLVDLNASAAAIRAKYSEKSADQLGYQLLQKPSVKAAIEEGLRRKFERADLRADRVLLELKRIAFGTMRDIADFEGGNLSIKDFEDLDEDGAALLKSISISESSGSNMHGSTDSKTLSFAMQDKVRALELLARHFKLLTDKIEIDDSSGLAERLARARKRREK